MNDLGARIAYHTPSRWSRRKRYWQVWRARYVAFFASCSPECVVEPEDVG